MIDKTVARNCSGSQLAEFAPGLFLLVVFLIAPFFCVSFFAAGIGLSFFATTESAKSAAAQSNCKTAANAAESQMARIAQTGFGKLLHCPNSSQVFIEGTDLSSGKTVESLANEPLVHTFDSEHYRYEVEVRSSYKIGPMFHSTSSGQSGLILFASPVVLVLKVRRTAEYPEGLCVPKVVSAPAISVPRF